MFPPLGHWLWRRRHLHRRCKSFPLNRHQSNHQEQNRSEIRHLFSNEYLRSQSAPPRMTLSLSWSNHHHRKKSKNQGPRQQKAITGSANYAIFVPIANPEDPSYHRRRYPTTPEPEHLENAIRIQATPMEKRVQNAAKIIRQNQENHSSLPPPSYRSVMSFPTPPAPPSTPETQTTRASCSITTNSERMSSESGIHSDAECRHRSAPSSVTSDYVPEFQNLPRQNNNNNLPQATTTIRARQSQLEEEEAAAAAAASTNLQSPRRVLRARFVYCAAIAQCILLILMVIIVTIYFQLQRAESTRKFSILFKNNKLTWFI